MQAGDCFGLKLRLERDRRAMLRRHAGVASGDQVSEPAADLEHAAADHQRLKFAALAVVRRLGTAGEAAHELKALERALGG